MSFLESNLAILDKYNPPLAALLRNVSERNSLSPYSLSTTRTGQPTVEIGGQLIHSRFDPVKESDRFVENQLSPSASLYIQGGFGLGYHSEALLAKTANEILLVVEPDLLLFLQALSLRDLTEVTSSGRVVFLVNREVEDIITVLEQFPGKEVQLLIVRSLYDYMSEYYDSLRNTITNYISRRKVNLSTLQKFGKLWLRNLSENAHLLATAPGITTLEKTFEGLPTLLIAAGPSLDLILPILGELQNRFVIVAVDTALRACLKAGIEPDFTVVADPQFWNSRHLDRCITGKSILISDISTFPSVFRQIRGKHFLCSSAFPLGRYLEAQTETKGKLKAGGSVSTAAWDFCRLIGSTEIWCAGLDLGFPDKQTHCRGSFFEQRVHWLSHRDRPAENASWHALIDAGLHTVKSNDGESTWSDRRMKLYIQWFEEQMSKFPSLQSYNISPKGVNIEGMDYASLEDALRKKPSRGEIEKRITHIRSIVPEENLKDKLISAISSLLRELSALNAFAEKGMDLTNQLEKLFYKGEDLSEVLAELDRLDDSILRQSGKEIAGFILQNFISEILKEKESPDPESIIRNSRSLYRKLHDSICFNRELMEKALKNSKNPQV